MTTKVMFVGKEDERLIAPADLAKHGVESNELLTFRRKDVLELDDAVAEILIDNFDNFEEVKVQRKTSAPTPPADKPKDKESKKPSEESAGGASGTDS